MVENMYVVEQLAYERLRDRLMQADQHRLKRAASEAPPRSAPTPLVVYPTPKRA